MDQGSPEIEFTRRSGTDTGKLIRQENCSVRPIGLRDRFSPHPHPKVAERPVRPALDPVLDALKLIQQPVPVLNERGVGTFEEVLLGAGSSQLWRAQESVIVENDLDGIVRHEPTPPRSRAGPNNPANSAKSCSG